MNNEKGDNDLEAIIDSLTKRVKELEDINEGWLYSKDKNSIKLFASYDREDDGSFSFGDRTMIPRAWVKKIQKL